jgi:transposase
MDGSRVQKTVATKKFNNNRSGFKELSEWITRHRSKTADAPDVCAVIEATGTYHENLTYYLHDLDGVKPSVLLANKAKAFSKSLNMKTKTDKADAAVLAQMGLERTLEEWVKPSESMRGLRTLSRERDSLLEEKTAFLNQKHALEHSHNTSKSSLKRIDKMLDFIGKQINEIEAEIKGLIKNDPIIKEEVERLTSIPGVGLTTAVTVLAETDGFSMIRNAKQLVSYAGFDVAQKQSGSSVNGKTQISKKGNSHLRKSMYFPAITHVSNNGVYAHKLAPIFERTGIKMKGYVAIQRKILVLMYTLHKTKSFYNPNHEQDKARAQDKKVGSMD